MSQIQFFCFHCLCMYVRVWFCCFHHRSGINAHVVSTVENPLFSHCIRFPVQVVPCVPLLAPVQSVCCSPGPASHESLISVMSSHLYMPPSEQFTYTWHLLTLWYLVLRLLPNSTYCFVSLIQVDLYLFSLISISSVTWETANLPSDICVYSLPTTYGVRGPEPLHP